MTDDLRRRLENLADRGEPRGADAVLAAARHRAGVVAPPHPPLFVVAAVAAAVLGLLGTTAVVTRGGDGHDRDRSWREFAGQGAGGAADAPPVVDLRGVRLVQHTSCRSFVETAVAEALARVSAYGVPELSGGRLAGGPTPRWFAVRRITDGSVLEQGEAGLGGEASSTGDPGPLEADDPGPLEADDSGSLSAMTRGAGAAPRFSDTNVQEAGIDEPDIVETDGRRLFTLVGEYLRYATLEPGRARYEGSLHLPGAHGFVLVGERAVVFGERATDTGPSATVAVVDVRSPAMGVVATLVFEGLHVSARVVDGVVRVVVRSHPEPLAWHYPVDGSDAERRHAEARNRVIVRGASEDHWLPELVVEDGLGGVRSRRPLVDCDDTFRPQAFSGFGTLTVVTLDPTNPDAVTSTSVQADGETVYASRSRLYVATVEQSLHRPAPTETAIHAFDIGDRTTTRYTGSGRVPGTTIGQFAFSEHEGHLRVATTVDEFGSTTESVVTVLRETAAGLEPVGRLGGLGRTEHIYAVRFMGPVGYVVTFRRTDPLYVVDLADPRRPRLVGELKVPGYSSYLHPVGDGLLLGIGQDADDDGRVKGFQVSLFDVSDAAAPKRLHQRTLSASSGSLAEADHHAFLWWAPRRLAVLPISEAQTAVPAGSAVGFSVRRDGIDEVARIEHPGGHRILRAVVVGSDVFTVSRAGVLAADLRDLSPGAWTPYPL